MLGRMYLENLVFDATDPHRLGRRLTSWFNESRVITIETPR
jgi:hypothetical protein